MAALSTVDLQDELKDVLDDINLVESVVLLVPPRIPLTCFPAVLEKLLSTLLEKEWSNLSERAQNYLKWISVKAESVDVLVPRDVSPPTKGFEMLSIDRDGRSFGGILGQCKQLEIPADTDPVCFTDRGFVDGASVETANGSHS